MTEKNMSDTNAKRRVGRPTAQVAWPDGVFTVEQLHLSTKISKVTLYQKVGQALKTQTIIHVGNEKSKGRPRDLYKKAPVVTPAPVPVVEPKEETLQDILATKVVGEVVPV